ncbi:DinB family protein [Naumannella huperziae]
MVIAPDTKDWTWVINDPCPECGFDPASVTRDNLVARMTAALEPWSAILQREDVRVRPDPDTWSEGEYGAHIADVCEVMAGRIALILAEDDPEFANWDQDRAAAEGDYPSRDPQRTADQIAGVSGERWNAPAAAPTARGPRRTRSASTRCTILSTTCGTCAPTDSRRSDRRSTWS